MGMTTTRRLSSVGFCLFVAGCSESSAPLRPETEEARASPPTSARMEVGKPSAETPAFLPRDAGCRSPYEEIHESCVHAYYRSRVNAQRLAQEVEWYRRGASSPKADGADPQPMNPEMMAMPTTVQDPGRLDPSALTVKRDDKAAPAQVAEAERLKALDALLASVRESVVSARVQRLPLQADEPPATPRAEPAAPTTASTLTQAERATGVGSEDDAREPLGEPSEANLAGPPERQLGLAEAAEGESSTAAFESRLSQIRQIQTLLSDIPMEQRARLLRKLEQSGARTAVGDDTWRELVTRDTSSQPPLGD